MPACLPKRDIMPMRRDFSIWLAIWIPATTNISTQEICSVAEHNIMDRIERINPTVVVTLTVVHHLFVWTAVVNVWVATLSLVAKDYGKKKTKL
jgi:hypothetical protein